MISKQRQLFYFVGTKPYASLEEAQKEDLRVLATQTVFATSTQENLINDVLDWMLKHSKEIVDNLTTTPKSRLRGRKMHGAQRKKKDKPAEPEKAP